jgi:hypothetical protein
MKNVSIRTTTLCNLGRKEIPNKWAMIYEEAKPKKNPPRNPEAAQAFLRASAPTCNNKETMQARVRPSSI